MSATYDSNLTTAKDRMRHRLGDVDMTNALETDETYAAMLALHGELLGTAVMAEGLAARFAQKPDSLSADGNAISWRSRISTWLELARQLRKDDAGGGDGNATGGGVMLARRGGIPEAEYRRERAWWT